jgi:hypothetical protein
MSDTFCTDCNCHEGLHTSEGCACEDHAGGYCPCDITAEQLESDRELVTGVLRSIETRDVTYGNSDTEITLTCDCHPGVWGGRGVRTGLRTDPNEPLLDRAVYRLRTTEHQELRDRLAMLLPDGKLELLGS